MLKETLVKKINDLNVDSLNLLDVFELFEEDSNGAFLVLLENKIEYFFNIKNLKDKTREETLYVSRACFYYIAKKHGIKESVSSAYLKFGRASAYNLIEKFPSYCKYYPLQKTKIQLILNWYFEEYICTS